MINVWLLVSVSLGERERARKRSVELVSGGKNYIALRFKAIYSLSFYDRIGEVKCLMTEPVKLNYHPNWLRFMYVINIVLAMGMGLVYLVSPSTWSSLLGVPKVDPMWAAGYAYSYMVALGIIGLFGMLSPLKFSASLLLQATGKIVWILAVFVPALVGGSATSWSYELTLLFVFWIMGDLIATPWRHFLSK